MSIEGQDTVMNVSFDLLKAISNAYVYYEINIPESESDTNYLRTLFRTNVDASRLIKGIKGNFIISMMAELILKSFDFDVKFPVLEVRSFF